MKAFFNISGAQGLINRSIDRMKKIRYGNGFLDKINIAIFTLIYYQIPRTIRRKLPRIDAFISKLSFSIMNGLTISINGIKYVLVDYESFCITTNPKFETWMWNYLKPKKGEVFLDVGSHVGKYSFKVSKLVQNDGLVIAIEPVPTNYDALIKGIKLNVFRNVTALNIAAWNRNCELKIFIGDSSGHHSAKLDKSLGCIEVRGKKIDDAIRKFNINRIDWIKIDVEGSEVEVISGLKNILKRYSPQIIVEVRNENLPKIYSILEKTNYSLTPINESENRDNTIKCYYCTPKMRAEF